MKKVKSRQILYFCLFCVLAQWGDSYQMSAGEGNNKYERKSLVVGVIQPIRSAKLAFSRNGQIVFALAEGKVIKQGEVLSRLDDGMAKIGLEKMKAMLDNANIELERSLSIYNTNKALFKKKSVSRRTLRDSEFAVKSNQAKQKRAQAEVAAAKLDLQACVIKAPFAGVVVAVHFKLNEWVNAGKEVVTLVNPDKLELRTDVSLPLSLRLRMGQIADFTDESGKKIGQVRVKTILPVLDPASGLRRIIWSVDSKVRVLAGRYVNVLPW